MSDIPEPIFAYSQAGPRYTVDEAAKRMRGPGQDIQYLTSQLRGFVQRKLVHVRDKRGSGRTAANLFEADDISAAKILSLLTESGVSDNEILNCASSGLYNWDDSERSKAWSTRIYQSRHPISAALSGFVHDKIWSFRIDVMRNSQTGERHLSAFIYEPDEEEFASDPESGFEPRTTIIVALAPVFARVLVSPETAN